MLLFTSRSVASKHFLEDVDRVLGGWNSILGPQDGIAGINEDGDGSRHRHNDGISVASNAKSSRSRKSDVKLSTMQERMQSSLELLDVPLNTLFKGNDVVSLDNDTLSNIQLDVDQMFPVVCNVENDIATVWGCFH